jgi:hypothetical protein
MRFGRGKVSVSTSRLGAIRIAQITYVINAVSG